MARIAEDMLRSIKSDLISDFNNKWLPAFLKHLKESDEDGDLDEIDLDDYDFVGDFGEFLRNEF